MATEEDGRFHLQVLHTPQEIGEGIKELKRRQRIQFEEDKQEFFDKLLSQDQRATAHPMYWVEFQYKDDENETWHRDQPFFTNDSAEQYIAEQNDNEVNFRVYISSGHHNKEWQLVRKIIMGDRA